MHPVLKDEPGGRALLLGNEAIVRGAVEAGCAVATGYPGTPASEIGDTFARIADLSLLHFEYSINEKVAYEVAHGACLGGVRAICSMKHLGLNVAADPLVTSAYVGTVGGLVIVSAADPGCHTSPNEQDHRYIARMSYIPILDPSDPAEALVMAREAFALSERWNVPVILRPTTRVAHTQGVVTLGALPPRPGRGAFRPDPRRFVPVPPNARRERLELIGRIRKAGEEAASHPWNSLARGSGRLGIVTSGVAYAYVLDALDDLGLAGVASVLKIGMSFPLPAGMVEALLGLCDDVLVVEEIEPFIEEAVKAASRGGARIRGKTDGTLPTAGEYGPRLVAEAIAAFSGRKAPPRRIVHEPPRLPPRPAILCAGCPHRSTFLAVKIAADERAVYMNDIGCYTLGYGPPLDLADVLLSMGSSLPQASGMSAATGRKAVAFIGDSTFFHSGVTGLLNAAYNRHDLLVVVLDNRVTGMTGHQPSPAMERTGEPGEPPQLLIEEVARASGASRVVVVDPSDVRAASRAIREAYLEEGLRVVVSRAPCAVEEARKREGTTRTYRIDPARCSVCHLTCGDAACGLSPDPAFALVRAGKRVDLRPSGTAGGLAPCSAGCPANLCIPGFIASFQAGDVASAYGIIRRSLPLSSVLSRVCPRPCEQGCVRPDSAVAINDIKRAVVDLATDSDRKAATEALRAGRPSTGKRVAVVGAGPAGLAAANDLALAGHSVTIFEATGRAGGLLAWAIPAFRLPRDVLERDVEDVLALGVELRTGQRLGRDFTVESLLEGGHDAVLLALGAGAGRRLGIAGEDARGVHDVIDLLGRVSGGERPRLGQRVLVVGGGDSAVDGARTALRLGAREVRILYRRTRGEMPAGPHEVARARDEGVLVEDQVVPVAVLVSEGVVRGLACKRTRPGEPDEDGRRRPVAIEGSDLEIQADAVIVATGQGPAVYPPGVAATRDGFIDVDHLTGATSDPRVFAAGDAVLGPATVVGAVATGRTAARAIHARLTGEPAPVEPLFHGPADASGAGLLVPEHLGGSLRLSPPALDPLGARSSFEEVATGASCDQALAEAGRCAGCATCARCDACITTFGCPAFLRDATGSIQIDAAQCNGCGVCALLCPNGAIVPAGEAP